MGDPSTAGAIRREDDGLLDIPRDFPLRAPWISHVSKSFPGTLALNDVSLDVHRGTVHCLLGGNGSGKSTLIKILAGVYQGDPGGEIGVGMLTVPANRITPEWARAAGLHFVHQPPAVFPTLTVAENMAIGRGFPTSPIGAVRWRALRRHTQAVLDRLELHIRPDALVGDLRPAERTMLAIARALQDQADASEGILVLDEPTSSLQAREVDLLLDALRRYATAGQTILFVTHRLDEVLQIADRVTVLRDARVVSTLPGEGLTQSQLVELIVGRPLEEAFAEMPAVTTADLVLEARGLAGGPLTGVDLGLRRGEVLGIAGLLGSGRTELLKMLFGADPIAHGTVKLDGHEVRFPNVGAAMDAGMAFVPEARDEAAFVDMTLRENLSAAEVGKYWKGLRLNHQAEAQDAQRSISDFFIKAFSDRQPFATLSGGNQQKAIVARWLRQKPKVLLLDEPTQGVDVNSRAEIYGLVRDAVRQGTSAIVVTSDFEELAHVVDRALVLRNGRIVAELRAPDIDPLRLTELVLTAAEGPTTLPQMSSS
jgi:ribose transport system ATP-binding protein